MKAAAWRWRIIPRVDTLGRALFFIRSHRRCSFPNPFGGAINANLDTSTIPSANVFWQRPWWLRCYVIHEGGWRVYQRCENRARFMPYNQTRRRKNGKKRCHPPGYVVNAGTELFLAMVDHQPSESNRTKKKEQWILVWGTWRSQPMFMLLRSNREWKEEMNMRPPWSPNSNTSMYTS